MDSTLTAKALIAEADKRITYPLDYLILEISAINPMENI